MKRDKDFGGDAPPATELALTPPPLQQLMTARYALSLHSVEGLLEQFEIGSLTSFFARAFDPLLFERVLRRAVGFVEDAENPGERELGEFVGSELVGNIMPQLVLGCAVPFLFLDHFEAAAFLRIGRIEHVGKKFDAFRQASDDAEALESDRAIDHFHHA